MALYIIQFGMDDLIPIPWVARNTDSAEDMYKKCVDAGKPWRELFDVPNRLIIPTGEEIVLE